MSRINPAVPPGAPGHFIDDMPTTLPAPSRAFSTWTNDELAKLDEFAKAALPAVIKVMSKSFGAGKQKDELPDPAQAASVSYRFAKAMLRERSSI
jgi:hypothetical protein